MSLPDGFVPAYTVHEAPTGNPAAPVVVVGSSIGTTSRVWSREVRALQRQYRVLSYEHPGHGADVAATPSRPRAVPVGPYSIADLGRAVLRILDRLDIGSAHAVGLSLGGAVTLWLGMHAPARVDSLTIVCSAATFAPPEYWTDRAVSVRSAGTVATPAISNGLPDRWLTGQFRRTHPEVVAQLVAGLAAINPEGYAGCCEALAGWDATGSVGAADDIGTITAPTLVIAGAHDPATPVASSELIRDRIPGSQLEVVEASHLAPVEVDLSAPLLDHLRAASVAHPPPRLG